jgi:hypothetical protein
MISPAFYNHVGANPAGGGGFLPRVGAYPASGGNLD